MHSVLSVIDKQLIVFHIPWKAMGNLFKSFQCRLKACKLCFGWDMMLNRVSWLLLRTLTVHTFVFGVSAVIWPRDIALGGTELCNECTCICVEISQMHLLFTCWPLSPFSFVSLVYIFINSISTSLMSLDICHNMVIDYQCCQSISLINKKN